MSYAEGSPLHPSYGQGHGTIAGACATILKAFFDEDQKIVNPAVPNRDGTALEPYTGPDHDQLTLGGELTSSRAMSDWVATSLASTGGPTTGSR